MSTKHTPGPWLDLGLESGFGYVIKHEGGKAIAYIAAYDLDRDTPEPYGKWSEDEIANRALVLAAPDLLEALRYARRMVKPSECDVAFIDAAIAKATGEQP